MKTQKGFTLVEILIVVVILGILAAIVIPQFTDASAEANRSRMNTDLQTLRSQIELYKIQHLGNLPHDTDGVVFAQKLTGLTDQAGVIDAGTLGPYMQVIPENPYNLKNTIRLETSDVAPTNADGWKFDTVTGFLEADHDPNLAS